MSFTANIDDVVAENRTNLLGKHPKWERVRLKEVATILNGYPFESGRFKRSGGTPLIRIRDILDGQTETFYDGEFDSTFLVKRGEILIGMDGDFHCEPWAGEPALLNQRVCKITPDESRYEKRFLRYLLPGYLSAINAQTPSVTVKHLSSRTIADIPLPLPPLPEQRRIVAELEKQFTRLEAGVTALRRVQANLKRYRAAVLKAACEGRLVPTEAELHRKRKTKNSKFETGAELLARILTERRQNWQGRGQYKEPAEPDSEIQQEIPEGWATCSVGQVSECLDGKRVPINKAERAKRHGEVPYYGANGQVGWIDDYLFDEPLVLVVEDETFTGRTQAFSYVIRGKTWVNNHAHVLRATGAVSTAYLNYSLAHYPFTARTTGSTGRRKLTQKALMGAPYLLPPLAEQMRIVAEVERRLSVVEELEAAVSANLQRATRLRQSILQKAFTGELLNSKGATS